MAGRRHFKYIVRDQYGFVIQNARVYFYQPGTTTNFLGAAYDALTGGSAITNPQITNSQGEVEGFFDTPQDLDILVDDNGDTAYRAVNGAGSTISFTPFTEKGVVLLVLSDTAAVKPRTTASAGTDADPAREDHIHPFASSTGKTTKFTTTSDTNEQLLQSYTVAASTLAAGSQFRIVVMGHQTNGTTACTFTFRVRWGGLAGTQLHSIAFVGTTTAHTDNPHHMIYLVNFQAVGATGAAVVQVMGDECITTTTANTPKLIVDPQTSSIGSLDTTASKDLSVTIQMSTTTGTPQFEIDNILIEQVS